MRTLTAHVVFVMVSETDRCGWETGLGNSPLKSGLEAIIALKRTSPPVFLHRMCIGTHFLQRMEGGKNRDHVTFTIA